MKEAIVLYPAATSHQMISMVELAKLILQHHPNISITILVAVMPFDTSTISAYISSISQTSLPISFLSLPPPSENPPGPAAAATLGKAAFDYIRLYSPKVLDALKTISLTSTVLAFIISTFGITYDTPIPTYLYFTSGASSFASILYLPTIHNQTTKSFKDLPNNTPLHFPGLPPIKPSHLPEPLLETCSRFSASRHGSGTLNSTSEKSPNQSSPNPNSSTKPHLSSSLQQQNGRGNKSFSYLSNP